MSDAGRAKFAHSYDDLAVAALAFMRQKSSSAANGVERSIDLVAEFAQLRGDELVNRAWKGAKDSSRGSGEQSSVRSRSELIANLLSEDGFAATVHETGRGVQICQHHCPVAHVAAAFPELCEAETAAISKIAGTHVQRLATIAHGDGVCTTYIPDLHMPEITSRS
jgi:predicted ArsR family transcriptional regulator